MIGTGERCLPGDADNCGDGGKASDARLSYPKGKFLNFCTITNYRVLALIVKFKSASIKNYRLILN